MTAPQDTASTGAQMLTALVRLRGALQSAQLPLDAPGVEERRTARSELVDQLEDYVIPRVMTVDAPLLVVVGGSTGGTIYKALEFIAAGKLSGTVVTPVADGGEKYLGSVFDDEWMAKRDLLDPTIAAQLDGWLPGRARVA